MPIKRHFLGWSQPALPAAAEFLLEKYRLGQAWDLTRVIVVVPGQRAGRRLLEILVELAEKHGVSLCPPVITTEGHLPERLYQPKRELASHLVQQLTWNKVLRHMPHDKRRHFLPQPPDETDTAAWLQLSELLQRLHQELAADGLDFGDVLTRAKKLEGFTEAKRWQTLHKLQRAYLDELDSLNLWDLQTARLVAIDHEEFHTESDIVLVGMVDLNVAMRKILDQLGGRVAALIHAPQSLAESFDSHGCLLSDYWRQAEIPLEDEQMVRVDGPVDQAEAVTHWLESLGGRYRLDEIVVGVPDSALVPQLQRQLAQCDVPSRWVEGKLLAETGPYRLLEAIGRYGERRRFDDLAALVRHGDVQQWLEPQLRLALKTPLDPLVALDEYYCDHFPTRLELARLDREVRQLNEKISEQEQPSHYLLQERDVAATVLAIVRLVEELLQDLPERPQKLAAWSEALRQIVVLIYGTRLVDRNSPVDRYLFEACQRINEQLGALTEIPAAIEPVVPISTAMDLVLGPLSRDAAPPPAREDAIELLGWLELAMDDAPALAITTFNDGYVPRTSGSDAFLPNRLRQHLGVLNNDRRYARDAYALRVLRETKQNLKLVIAHRDSESNPLPPSRLLFSGDKHTVAARALKLFAPLEAAKTRRILWPDVKQPRRHSTFAIPEPRPCPRPIERMSVTHFKTYLACPYRFYLRHVLRLQCIADGASELDAAAFGDLVHSVLQHFGRADDGVRHSTKPDAILDYLSEHLDRLALARFGEHLGRPAIRVQVEQARTRLRAFADWQAGRIEQGWRIAYSEEFDRMLGVEFDVDGTPLLLQGRIDRIDVSLKTGQWQILDYKTSDTANKPERSHRKASGEWIDLQLPLYRHLLAAVDITDVPRPTGEVQLGYLNLPKDTSRIEAEVANWSPADLETADDVARDIVRQIRQEVFWPPAQEPPPFSEDLSPICQDGLLNPWRPVVEGEAK